MKTDRYPDGYWSSTIVGTPTFHSAIEAREYYLRLTEELWRDHHAYHSVVVGWMKRTDTGRFI